MSDYFKAVKSVFWKHANHTGAFCPGKNHVNNMSDQDIWIRIDCDRSVVMEANTKVDGGWDAKFGVGGNYSRSERLQNVRIADCVGFTKVKPNSILLFRPGHIYNDSSKYITVYSNEGSVIVKSHPIGCNDSCIIDKQGYFRRAKMGTVDVVETD